MTAELPDHALELRSLVTSQGTLELSLHHVPVPSPAANEVLVRVEASPINPSDLALLIAGADMTTAKVSGTPERPIVTASGTVKLLSGAAEADDLGVDRQPEGPSWARCRTRVTGIRRRSSRTVCGCITGSR